jgi:putative ABC transport system substrate-binding protein
MRRRALISLLGGTTATWPLTTRAQLPANLPTIGFLGTASPSSWSTFTSAFEERLHELRWIEGRTISIAYRWAEGRRERVVEISAEFIRLKVDVIVTSGFAGIEVKHATSTIPVVLALANDPVGQGLVTSLARPGGNVTGLSLEAPDLAGKRLELLREVFPDVHRLAILANGGYPAAVLEMRKAETMAHTLGLDVVTVEIREEADIAPAFAALKDRIDALYAITDPLTRTYRLRINSLASAARLPTIHGEGAFAEAGGLMSYGPYYPDMFRRAAEYVDKILRGAKPGDLPVEQPTSFRLIINLKTAKALSLTIPPSIIGRADEVIE